MNAPIDVRLGREVEDRITAFRNRGKDRVTIADITFDESVPGLVETFKVFQIAGVGQGVEIHDLDVRLIFKNKTDKSRTDKSRTACNKNCLHKLTREKLKVKSEERKSDHEGQQFHYSLFTFSFSLFQ